MLRVDGPATTQRETIRVHATGFTPEATVDLYRRPGRGRSAPADAFGETDVRRSPRRSRARPASGAFTLAVVERDNPSIVASTGSRVTNLAVTLRPKPAQPSRRVRFSGRGFTKADRPIFAHYVFGGELQKTVRLARRPTGPCGVFSASARQIPIRNARVGDWLLQIDQQRRLRAERAGLQRAAG